MARDLKILCGLLVMCGILVAGCSQKPQDTTTEPNGDTDESVTQTTEPAEDITRDLQLAPATDESTPAEEVTTAEEEEDEEDTVVDDETVPSDESDTTIAELKIGDPAPALVIDTWVKGDEVAEFQEGHVYVVEFWATWCPPCRTSMPHLSQLQTNLADQATFIGISSETEETVQGFLEKVQDEETGKTWNEVVSYTLAMDAGRATGDAYMRAAGQGGIPTAFIVGKDGHVEWIGHPMTMDDPIDKILANQWDREAEAERFAEAQRAKKAYQTAMSVIRTAQQDGDWTAALEAVDELINGFPSQTNYQMLKIQVLQRAGRAEEITALAKQLAEDNKENANLLNQLSWMLATSVPEPYRDLELAMGIAKQASSLKDDADATILDTVARIYYEQGELEQAIEWQKKAVESGGGASPQIRRSLEKYEGELAAAAAPDVETEANADVEADAETEAATDADAETATESADTDATTETEATTDEQTDAEEVTEESTDDDAEPVGESEDESTEGDEDVPAETDSDDDGDAEGT